MAITVISMGLLSVEIPGQVKVESGPAGGMTLRSLIFDHLASQHDSALPGTLLDAQGQPKPGYAILVDGRNAMQLGGLDVLVKDGSTVMMTAMVSGG
jgi:molybdopterin converting factor small subunit